MSQGFNPRPRFSLPAPLSLGIEGWDEVLELDLTEELEPEELARKLSLQMPHGIDIIKAESTNPGTKAHVASVRYRVTGQLPDGAVERCLASGELPATRDQGRHINIRPYLRSVVRTDSGCECEVLVTNEGSARPAELLDALFGTHARPPNPTSLVRTSVNLATP